MESRKSKKTRSHGEASKGSRDPRSSLSPPVATSRPQLKDRVKSAPLVAQTLRSKPEKLSKHASTSSRATTRGNRDPDSPPLTPAFPSLPSPARQEEVSQGVSTPRKDDDGLREITLAVLGAEQAGKTTFVQCALDLKKPSTAPITTKKVSLEGVVSVLRLLEVPFEAVAISSEQDLEWPETLGGQSTPPVDGALVLYDVMNQESLTRVPTILSGLSRASLPALLVSSKCDEPPNTWDVDHDIVEQLSQRFHGLESFQTSATAPETHKRCISVILRNISSKKSRTSSSIRTTRLRALTTTHSLSEEHAPQITDTRGKHTRAASELPGIMTRSPDMLAHGPHHVGNHPTKSIGEQPSQQLASPPNSPPATSGTRELASRKRYSQHSGDDRVCTASYETVTAPKPSQAPSISGMKATPVSIANSFLDIDEDVPEAAADERTKSSAPAEEPPKDSGSSFEDLVDRLLSQPMSKSDGKFAAIFLCLYRKFAAPSVLLSTVIHRFQALNESDQPQISRTTSQLRCLGILAQWVSDYPGDFAHAHTRCIMTNFVTNLVGSRAFAVAAKEIGSQLEIVSEDDDTEWACSDKSRSRANTVESFLSMSSVQSTTSTLNADSSTEDVASGTTKEEVAKKRAPQHSASASLSSSTGRSESQSTGSFQTLLNSVENAQRQAQFLTPTPRSALTKAQWHQLMDIPDEDVARELTRIDWIMFSSIRPRDLIRHVSLPSHEKDKCRSLENVNRMIDQFNHVAFWVANLIVLRDKSKHRARMLEKFMGIAWKLRHLNNYNSLGAVVAGINGTAVHRLTQTREMVPQQVQKQFMRLEILMGTQKSHSAYRLAWTNTSTERVPFLPLHRRDLVLAEEGNRTYLDESNTRINWRKFELMGDVVVGIQRSQGTPYPTISKNEEVQRLVLDGKFHKDDDELYERSIQIEGPGVGETRRRFNWYKR